MKIQQRKIRYGLQIGGGLALALAVGLILRSIGTGSRQATPGITDEPTDAAAHRNASSETDSRRESRHRDHSAADEEQQRKAALDLANRMKGKQDLLMSDRMAKGDEEHFPETLLDEAGSMNATQFRTLVLDLAKDPSLTGPNRATLVGQIAAVWSKNHLSEGKEPIRQLQDVIGSVLPDMPRGYDVLPVSCAMGPTLTVYPESWVDFLESQWDRWSRSGASSHAEVVRRDLLEYLTDQELRARVEKWPKAGH